jgi:hypothetical protein
VFSVPSDVPAAERARWLAEVSAALDAASELIARLDFAPEDTSAKLDLCIRIETARVEVRSLRLSRSLQSRPQIGSERIEFGLWQREAPTA